MCVHNLNIKFIQNNSLSGKTFPKRTFYFVDNIFYFDNIIKYILIQ